RGHQHRQALVERLGCALDFAERKEQLCADSDAGDDRRSDSDPNGAGVGGDLAGLDEEGEHDSDYQAGLEALTQGHYECVQLLSLEVGGLGRREYSSC
ncbi:MAG: hypothetical protein WD118_05005, partial [Phycisphaeraceae bacterium]